MPRLTTLLLAGVIGTLATVSFSSGAFAAQKNTAVKNTTPASITLNPGDPSLGATVSFAVAYSGSVKNPMIEIDCYQNDAIVWAAVQSVGSSFVLGGDSSPWTVSGGSASCTSNLEYFTWKGNTETGKVVMASSSFEAT